MMQRMGFTDRLGATEQGIATHIETFARPERMGLGFRKERNAQAAVRNRHEEEAEQRRLDEERAAQEAAAAQRKQRAREEAQRNAAWKTVNAAKAQAHRKLKSASEIAAATAGDSPEHAIVIDYTTGVPIERRVETIGGASSRHKSSSAQQQQHETDSDMNTAPPEYMPEFAAATRQLVFDCEYDIRRHKQQRATLEQSRTVAQRNVDAHRRSVVALQMRAKHLHFVQTALTNCQAALRSRRRESIDSRLQYVAEFATAFVGDPAAVALFDEFALSDALYQIVLPLFKAKMHTFDPLATYVSMPNRQTAAAAAAGVHDDDVEMRDTTTTTTISLLDDDDDDDGDAYHQRSAVKSAAAAQSNSEHEQLIAQYSTWRLLLAAPSDGSTFSASTGAMSSTRSTDDDRVYAALVAESLLAKVRLTLTNPHLSFCDDIASIQRLLSTLRSIATPHQFARDIAMQLVMPALQRAVESAASPLQLHTWLPQYESALCSSDSTAHDPVRVAMHQVYSSVLKRLHHLCASRRTVFDASVRLACEAWLAHCSASDAAKFVDRSLLPRLTTQLSCQIISTSPRLDSCTSSAATDFLDRIAHWRSCIGECAFVRLLFVSDFAAAWFNALGHWLQPLELSQPSDDIDPVAIIEWCTHWRRALFGKNLRDNELPRNAASSAADLATASASISSLLVDWYKRALSLVSLYASGQSMREQHHDSIEWCAATARQLQQQQKEAQQEQQQRHATLASAAGTGRRSGRQRAGPADGTTGSLNSSASAAAAASASNDSDSDPRGSVAASPVDSEPLSLRGVMQVLSHERGIEYRPLPSASFTDASSGEQHSVHRFGDETIYISQDNVIYRSINSNTSRSRDASRAPVSSGHSSSGTKERQSVREWIPVSLPSLLELCTAAPASASNQADG